MFLFFLHLCYRWRIDDRDWVVMGDRWGDMKVCVMDWSHDTCSTWQPESDQLTLRYPYT